MLEWTKLALIALGGSVGSISRYYLSQVLYHKLGADFAWGTLLANLIGCFLMGVLVGAGLNANYRAFVLVGVGFLGSLTTFSAFSVETLGHVSDGRYGLFTVNLLANVSGALVAASVGILVARVFGLGAASE